MVDLCELDGVCSKMQCHAIAECKELWSWGHQNRLCWTMWHLQLMIQQAQAKAPKEDFTLIDEYLGASFLFLLLVSYNFL